jgi:hypothetical protein
VFYFGWLRNRSFRSPAVLQNTDELNYSVLNLALKYTAGIMKDSTHPNPLSSVEVKENGEVLLPPSISFCTRSSKHYTCIEYVPLSITWPCNLDVIKSLIIFHDLLRFC